MSDGMIKNIFEMSISPVYSFVIYQAIVLTEFLWISWTTLHS